MSAVLIVGAGFSWGGDPVAHWLEAVGRILVQPGWSSVGGRALILGDPAHRAAGLFEAAGMSVVRVATSDEVAVQWFERELADTVVRADAEALPFPDDAFDLVIVHGTLEFCHDDRRVVGELTRVTRAGGYLVFRLPRRGRLAGLDSLNLYRYIGELVGHADIPPESEPIGWRRHYDESDLDAIFAPYPLALVRVEWGGLALGEAAYLPAMLATRTTGYHPAAVARLRGLYARYGDWDERLPGPSTFAVTARKKLAAGAGGQDT